MPQSPNDWMKFFTDHFFTVICTLLGAIIYAQQTQSLREGFGKKVEIFEESKKTKI